MKFKLLTLTISLFLFSNLHSSHVEKIAFKPRSPQEGYRQSLLKNRQHLDLLNFLVSKYGYKSYLEIGLADGKNLSQVIAQRKVGVDPSSASPATHQMTSDDFFATNQETFDLIFIDGLHLYEQVLRDVENSLNCLNPGGLIVMHDCMPIQIQHQARYPIIGDWNGDVWKAAALIRMHAGDVHFCVLDMDWGCGILTPDSTQTLFPATPVENMDWNFYVQNKKQLLNVVSVEEWVKGLPAAR
jgi:SAM-dependent methyltransferase